MGVSSTEVTGSFQQLPVLVGAAGLPPAGIAHLQQTFDEHGENMRVYSAGSTPIGGPVQDLPFAPGEPLGAAISYGDAALYATGTATFVCGNEVAAFGHPFFYDAPGDISLGLAGANGLMVLGGQFFPGSRFATLTEPRGQIVQDQFVGILGVEGQEPPSTPITPDTKLAFNEAFFIAEPQAQLLWNLSPRVRVTFGAGYRITAGADDVNDRIRGPIGSISVEFGGGH